jgi:prevent-host-death family protein
MLLVVRYVKERREMQREGEREGLETGGERYITATQARDDFSEFINQVAYGKERFIVKRRDKELAAVIPMEEYRFLERAIEAELDRQDREEISRITNDPNYAEDSVPLSEVKKEFGIE